MTHRNLSLSLLVRIYRHPGTYVVALATFLLVSSFAPVARTIPRQRGEAEAQDGVVGPISAYKLQWKRHFEAETSLLPAPAADGEGALWLIAFDRTDRGPKEFMARIDENGQLTAKRYLQVPHTTDESVVHMSLASNGKNVGLLVSLDSGGAHALVFERTLLLPVHEEGFGMLQEIVGRGSRVWTLTAAPPEGFIAAGDGKPTVLKLNSAGQVLWQRPFPSDHELPTVAVGTNGRAFVFWQLSAHMSLDVLDNDGKVVASKQISAKQGAVANDPNGGCTVLFSTAYTGKDNRVYLASFDSSLRQLRSVETPVRGRGGRTYQLISTPAGHLVIGEGPGVRQQVIADFDMLGRLRWQRMIDASFTPLLVPYRSGFYVVSQTLERRGTDVEKYSY